MWLGVAGNFWHGQILKQNSATGHTGHTGLVQGHFHLRFESVTEPLWRTATLMSQVAKSAGRIRTATIAGEEHARSATTQAMSFELYLIIFADLGLSNSFSLVLLAGLPTEHVLDLRQARGHGSPRTSPVELLARHQHAAHLTKLPALQINCALEH